MLHGHRRAVGRAGRGLCDNPWAASDRRRGGERRANYLALVTRGRTRARHRRDGDGQGSSTARPLLCIGRRVRRYGAESRRRDAAGFVETDVARHGLAPPGILCRDANGWNVWARQRACGTRWRVRGQSQDRGTWAGRGDDCTNRHQRNSRSCHRSWFSTRRDSGGLAGIRGRCGSRPWRSDSSRSLASIDWLGGRWRTPRVPMVQS